jgi:type IV pilus assembly protein PilB
MGIEPFLVTASLNLILAQRLGRKVCGECKQTIETPPEVLIDLGMSDAEAQQTIIYEGRGCRNCSDTGYKGRIAIYEVMPMYDEIKECVLQGYSAMELKREAIRLGMQTLRRAALNKLRDGVLSIPEVLRSSRKD